MAWRVAKSLDVGLAELKKVYPKRDTTSDGSIGDQAHAARNSKHNPGPDGIVEARDFDEDVDGQDDEAGRELWAFVQHLLTKIVKTHPAFNGPGAHIIYEGRIWSFAHNWVERPYTGLNAHKHHVHVAVVDGPGKDSTQTWRLTDLLATPTAALPPKPDRWLGLSDPRMHGPDVKNVKDYFRSLGNPQLDDNDIYDQEMSDVAQVYKYNRGITEAGVGPVTLKQIRKEIHGG